MKMTEEALVTEIKTGTLGGMYFFWGEEDYMKNHRTHEIKKAVLGGGFDEFSSFSFVFGEGECDIPALADAFSSPPMMTDRKFVSVFFSSLDSLKEKQKAALVDLLTEFSEDSSTVTVISANSDGFDAGYAKKPSTMLSTLGKITKCVEFPLRTDAKLIRWMERHFAGYGLQVDTATAKMILDKCGRSMYRLSGEIAKVAAHAAAYNKTAVDADDIEECVIENETDEAFGLANCILNGDTAGALSCLQIKIHMREEPIYVLGQVTKVFSDMCTARAFIDDGRDKNDYARQMKLGDYPASLRYRAAMNQSAESLSRAVELCRNADRMMKTGGGGYMPIERLICLSAGRR